VLTDNGLHFTDPRGARWTAAAIKELIARKEPFLYETNDQLRSHLADFVTAYNFANRLKTLKGLTPYEYICKRWTKEPDRFTLSPLQQMPGLNI
jgi:transposase InsO family protein